MARGYDNLRVNMELLLDLQFREGTGTVTEDWAKPDTHQMTLVGTPTWTAAASDLMHLDFDSANPDYLSCLAANTADLNFTTGAFSGAAWFDPDATGNRYVFCKSDGATGWMFYIVAGTGEMAFATAQAGPATQVTYGTALTLNTWQFVGFTRSGATATIYTNGVNVTATAGTHVNPASAAAINLYIGIYNSLAAGWLDGSLWRPRVWNRALTAAEMLAIYEGEKDFFYL